MRIMMRSRTLPLALVLLGLVAGEAAAVPGTMSFTARIATPAGTPVDGPVTATFRVFDAATAGTQVWTEDQSLTASNGLLFAELGHVLAFDSTVFDGSPRFLEMVINGETLTPRLSLLSVPYAIAAAQADHSASTDAIGALTASDLVTTVNPGAGLTGGGHGGTVSLSVDTSTIQSRVSGTCASGSAIQTIGANGTVTCQTTSGGIAGVTAGTGLTGGGTSGNVTLSVDTNAIQARVSGSCPAGSSIASIAANGSVTCQADTNSGGDITAVTAGTGLTGGGATGAVTLSVDTTAIQARVTGTCAAGSSIATIAANGTVTCNAAGSGTITGVTAGAGLTGGGTSGDVTLSIPANGVTMAQISAPVGSGYVSAAVTATATTQLVYTTPVFTADSAGTCMVTSKLHAETPLTGGTTGFLLLRVAVKESGTDLFTSADVNGTQPIASISRLPLDTGAAAPFTHWQADATNAVTVTKGNTYTFGCFVDRTGMTMQLSSSPKYLCQTTYVCQ
jgi:hypothetical protein